MNAGPNRPLLIHGGRIIDPANERDFVGDVLIDDGRIDWVWQQGHGDRPPVPVGVDFWDANGLVVTPGFIDLHCHLREPGQERKETIATGTLAAARGGFTTVCAMPNTEPPIDNAALVEFVLMRARATASVRVLPIATVTVGRMGAAIADLEEMAAAGAIAFSDDGSAVSDVRVMRTALTMSRSIGLPIIQHCEDPAFVGNGVAHEGWVSARLGLAGSPGAAEETLAARDIELAALTGGRLHLAHVSSSGTPDLVRRAKERGLLVTAEAMPHHLVLSHEWLLGERGAGWPEGRSYDTNLRVNPPIRRPEDAQALIAGLNDGALDAVATDHAPHTWEDKAVPFGDAVAGISGIETALGLLMTGLVHRGTVDLPTLIRRLTAGPAGLLPSAYRDDLRLGSLTKGAVADVAVLDPEAEWVVDPADFASKGKNTPLAGCNLRGRVVATISGGHVVYQNPEIPWGRVLERDCHPRSG